MSLVGAEDHFRVRFRAELGAARREITTQLAEVVDLAVEGDTDQAVVADHGLVARDEVDDGQAPVTEPGVPATDDIVAVRSAMSDHGGHGAEKRSVHGTARDVHDASDAAHG